jgi:sterol desaturase/sphingolipid hydroxylase (fatty acid hydroxylase superfamily)
MTLDWHHSLTEVVNLFHGTLAAYHGLNPRVREVLTPILIIFKYLPPILFLEWITGGGLAQYKSRAFCHDLVFWVLRTSKLYRTFFATFVLVVLAPYLKVFDLHLVDRLTPPPHYFARALLYLVVADFAAYWVHRLQHTNRFLWSFHTTHHSQRIMSFITLNRMHPVEEIFYTILTYIPLLLLGASAADLVPVIVVLRVVAYMQHSQVRWSFGPLAKVLVTPRFHAVHHSTDPSHHDRNFGVTFSVWDRLFGTAVDVAEWPKEFGLTDVQMPTVTSAFLVPFRMVYETYFKKSARIEAAGD